MYATLGTINTGQAYLFDKAIEASRGQPWQMVISVGRHLNLSRWTRVPENVLVRNYVPQPALLRQVQAVISRGGMNTVTETLAAGVPLGVAPAGADQFEAARRVVEAGAGLRLSLQKAKVEELTNIIRHLLEKPGFRENAQRIAKDYAKCDGPSTATALILRLTEKRAPLLRPTGRRATIYANEAVEIRSP